MRTQIKINGELKDVEIENGEIIVKEENLSTPGAQCAINIAICGQKLYWSGVK